MVLTSYGSTDVDELKRTYSCFPSGVTALCALRDGVPIGMSASAFTLVSLAPPMASVCVRKESTTWPLLQDRLRLGVSILSAEHEIVCRALAAKGVDRFANVDWEHSDSGAVFISGSSAWLECDIARIVEAGDHHLVLLTILAQSSSPDTEPLVFHRSRFRRLLAA